MTSTITALPNRMAKRRHRTRQQLLTATKKLILEHGYAEASTEAIAELADLGRSTFYNHFDNKQDIVIAMLTAHYQHYGKTAYVPLEESQDRVKSLARSSLSIFGDMARDPLTFQLIGRPRVLAKAIAESQSDFLASDFSEGVFQGRFKAIVNIESLTTILNWSLVGMLIAAINRDSIEEMSLEWTRFVLLNIGIEHSEIERIIESALDN